MYHIWQKIKADVEAKKWDTNGVEDMVKYGMDVVLSKHPIVFDPRFDENTACESTIGRLGDIVVGFYLNENVGESRSLKLRIGGVPLPDLKVAPGEFVYMFENTHPFPIIALQYSILKVGVRLTGFLESNESSESKGCCEGLHVIYAHINSGELRRGLANSTSILKFKSGRHKAALIRTSYLKFDHVGDVEKYLEAYPDWYSTYFLVPDLREPAAAAPAAYADKVIQAVDKEVKCI